MSNHRISMPSFLALHYRIFSFLCLLLVIFVGSIGLLWHIQQPGSTHASNAIPTTDAGTILGPPSLPAATVDAIFTRMGSPMVGTGKLVEQTSRQANIDDAFALGVWWTETNDGAAGVGSADRNPGSVRGSAGFPAAFDGYTIYPSYAAAIIDWFSLLKNRYVSRGLTSAYTLCYPYVGTSSAPLWAGKVVALMIRYRSEAPRVTPTPQPTVVPTPPSARNHRMFQPAVTISHLHVTRGELQEERFTQRTTTLNTSQSAQPASTTNPFIVLFGLLAALAIALASQRIGRKSSIVSAQTVTWASYSRGDGLSSPTSFGAMKVDGVVQTEPLTSPTLQPLPSLASLLSLPVTPLTSLFVNQFSPLLEPSTEALADHVPLSPSLPLQPTRIPVGARGGLLSRYGTSADTPPRTASPGPRKVTLTQ